MELNKMPKSLSSVAEAMTAFMQIIGLAKESLRKILLRGEFEEYAEDNRMHCTARLVEMLNQYSDELHRCPGSDAKSNFLMEEIKILEENKEKKPSIITIEGIGEVEVGVLRKYPDVLAQAYDLKMRMTAYWKVVLRRFVDFMALHLQLSVNNLVNKEMEAEIVNGLMGPYGGGIERMLEESPAVAVKREKLNKSIKKLRDSKEVVAKIMDSIITYGD